MPNRGDSMQNCATFWAFALLHGVLPPRSQEDVEVKCRQVAPFEAWAQALLGHPFFGKLCFPKRGKGSFAWTQPQAEAWQPGFRVLLFSFGVEEGASTWVVIRIGEMC